MTRSTPASNLRYFAASRLSFENALRPSSLGVGLRYRRFPRLRAKDEHWFEATFVENALWLELGARHDLFEDREVRRYFTGQMRALGPVSNLRGFETLLFDLRKRAGWPFRSQIDQLLHFYELGDPSSRARVSDSQAAEAIITDYLLIADRLAGDRLFRLLSKERNNPKSAKLPGPRKLDVDPKTVASLLARTDNRPLPAEPATFVAGFIRFLEFVSTIRDLSESVRQTEGFPLLRELCGIQYWRMNLRMAPVTGLAESVGSLSIALANLFSLDLVNDNLNERVTLETNSLLALWDELSYNSEQQSGLT
jgi:hypothetical protein